MTSTRRSRGAAHSRQGWSTAEGLRLGSVAGIPVILSRSWFVIAAIVTLTFEPIVASYAPDLARAASYAVALLYAVLLGVSVLVHELAHAATARAFGMPASRIVLTLWGGHTQFQEEVATPGRSFAIAAAGPAANAILAVAAWSVVRSVDMPVLTGLLTSAVAFTNGFVAVTNILPGLPLDGGRLLEAIVWRIGKDRDVGTIAAGWGGRIIAVATPCVVLGWPLVHGDRPQLQTIVWAAAIGALLWAGAGAALTGARIRRRAPSASVASLARPAVAVAAGTSLAAALESSGQVPGGAWVVVLDADGWPAAVLDPDAVAAVPPERRPWLEALSACRRLAPGAVVPPVLAGQDMLRALSDAPADEWVVLDDTQDRASGAAAAPGRVVGLLLAADVVAAVMGPRAAARA